jgi:hypothetical protein
VREYLPFGSWWAAWLLIGLTIGHADAVRLLAANTFAHAARALCTLEVIQVLARRSAADPHAWRDARRRALRIDLVALLVCAVLLAALIGFVAARGMPKAAAMIAIVALGIPARHPGSLWVGRLDRDLYWRIGSALVALGGAALVFALRLPWEAAAVVLALRDWGGLLMTALFAGPRSPPSTLPQGPLTFREAAVQTEARARKRLGYRLLRTTLGVLLGPYGSFVARTGRTAGKLDSKIARLLPHSRLGFALFTAGTGIAAAVLLSISREPSAFIGAAGCARLAASGAAALLWWKYRDFDAEDREEDDED